MRNKHYMWAKAGVIFVVTASLFSVIALAYSVDDDLNNRNNLSRTSNDSRISGLPKIKTSGANIAVVWSDGVSEDSKETGNIYVKTARDGDQLAQSEGYWRGKTAVFAGTETNWGQNPDFTFEIDNENLIHVIWSESANCLPGQTGNQCQFNKIRYRSCDIATDIISCPASPSEAVYDSTDENVINPQIVQDNNRGLHAVWLKNSVPQVVEYSYLGNGSTSWTTPVSVNTTQIDNESMTLFFHQGRLHFAWDKGDTIGYFYDNTLDNGTLSAAASERAFQPRVPGLDTNHTDAGNPTITGKDEWLFIGYDGRRDQLNSNQYTMYYARSTTNGSSWSDVFKIQDADFEGVPENLRLRPKLAISASATLTQVFAIWHERIPQLSGVKPDLVAFSDASFDDNLLTQQTWSPRKNVTYADTPVDDLLDEATVNPEIAITRLADGSKTGHLVYQENLIDGTKKPLEVFYQGSIAGTMDPAYVLDSFVGPSGQNGKAGSYKVVTPQVVKIIATTIVTDLHYTIAFTNEGTLNAIGIGITDTLPLHTALKNGSLKTYVNNVLISDGSEAKHNNGVITWYKDVIVPDMSIRIEFSLVTLNTLSIPTTVINKLDMWNQNRPAGGPLQLIQQSTAGTRIAVSINYLPLLRR